MKAPMVGKRTDLCSMLGATLYVASWDSKGLFQKYTGTKRWSWNLDSGLPGSETQLFPMFLLLLLIFDIILFKNCDILIG